MTTDIRQQAISATLWSGMDTLLKSSIQFLITLVLARLLTPENYGTVGLLAVFVGLAGIFIESGFSSALIQRKEVNEIDKSSVFFFNMSIALVAGLLLCLASGTIARFYRTPVLKPFTCLMALNLVIGALGSIQRTLLTKSLNFRRQCLISSTAILLSGIGAVILAWKGFGVWSLGAQAISMTSISTILLWSLSTWRPQWMFSLESIKTLFKFGGFLLISGLLDMLYTRINTLIIGKFYSAKELGYYSRADGTQQFPAGLLSGIISRVAFPIFSVAQADKLLLKAGLKKAITFVMMINIPMMLGLAMTAETVVEVLYGKQWLPCAVYLKILCLGGVLWPLHVLNLNILKAQGKSALMLRLEIIKKAIGLTLLGFACFYGIEAMAWSVVITSVICFSINAFYSGKFLGYGAIRQSLDLLPYLSGAVFLCLCVWCVTKIQIKTNWILLVSQVMCGSAGYALFCKLLGLDAFEDAVRIVKQTVVNRWIRKQL